jgi:hypothetical protein
MNLLTKLFVFFALTCGAAWLIKQVAIVATSSEHSDSTIVGVLWGVGMLTFLVAAALGAALAVRRFPAWARVIAAIVAVPVAFMVLQVIDAIVDAAYQSDGWFAQEIPLVLAALVMGGLGAQMLGSARRA